MKIATRMSGLKKHLVPRHWLTSAAVAVLMVGSSQLAQADDAEGPTVKVGDTAPALVQGEYVQGKPVKAFEVGTVYVVEFWATWCPPCRASIPHLNELAEQYADEPLVIIGQNCWERDEAKVAPFVKQMGEKMTYRVALDDKSSVEEGAMATTWMRAAGRNGIPSAFIVGKDGKIFWIGHPVNMEEALAKAMAAPYTETAAKPAAADQEVETVAVDSEQTPANGV